MKRNIILAAGGTGGHVFPALAVAQAALQKGFSPVLLLDQRGNSFLPKELNEIARVVLNIGYTENKLLFFIQLIIAFLNAFFEIAKLRPVALVGFGGYPSAPAVLAAWIWQVPIILCEQNKVLGRTNRILAIFAKKIAVAFPGTMLLPVKFVRKTKVVGIPLRQEIINTELPVKEEAKNKLTLLIIGGSQGAVILSQVLPKAIALLNEEEQRQLMVFHQVRAELLQEVTAAYKQCYVHDFKVATFFDDIWAHMSKADLLICRAGASTIAEIMHFGTPAVLVPYRYAADNHQYYNALYLVEHNAAELLSEEEFTAENLAILLRDFLTHTQRFEKLGIEAKKLSTNQAAESLMAMIESCSKKIG
jgi:UDP-N-acetylglucosamine--N-acetylmuramyl-(pentapeptide) pyrophosphoryl-undecaprenol N-acetylglucosamine transferase